MIATRISLPIASPGLCRLSCARAARTTTRSCGLHGTSRRAERHGKPDARSASRRGVDLDRGAQLARTLAKTREPAPLGGSGRIEPCAVILHAQDELAVLQDDRRGDRARPRVTSRVVRRLLEDEEDLAATIRSQARLIDGRSFGRLEE